MIDSSTEHQYTKLTPIALICTLPFLLLNRVLRLCIAGLAGTVFDRMRSHISRLRAISSESGHGRLSGEVAFSDGQGSPVASQDVEGEVE